MDMDECYSAGMAGMISAYYAISLLYLYDHYSLSLYRYSPELRRSRECRQRIGQPADSCMRL